MGRCPRPVFLVNHPEFVRHVLQDNHRNYSKSPAVDRIKPLFGSGLTTSDGELWRRQRKLISPLFQPHRTISLTPLIKTAVADRLRHWSDVARKNGRINVLQEMLNLTRNIIVQALFGPAESTDRVVEVLQAVVDHVSRDIWSVLLVAVHMPTPARLRFRRARRDLDAFIQEQIARRRLRGPAEDLLSELSELRDERTGLPMSDTQLRDEVVTLFIAGYTTTATALTWIWILLSRHPDVENKLHAEVAGVEDAEFCSAVESGALRYTRRVIEESMRLYPPTWITARIAIDEDQLGDCRIPEKSILLLSPYAMHRHLDFWDNPECFDPDRFLPERSAARPRYAYFPFGGGPRTCIGMGLAMQEMLWTVAMAARYFRLLPIDRREPCPHAGLTLTPVAGTEFAPLLLSA